eukprot:TRINITY_DN5020_c0_g3_i9.p1 TRINITY_DN5020_c0_g3~~TRINITY_DN5020_c0_g3_i9.p1  ORF type:complete len:258 (-),score=45.48 TRINITY_DN5020_c0_g3_i9:226-999(-)
MYDTTSLRNLSHEKKKKKKKKKYSALIPLLQDDTENLLIYEAMLSLLLSVSETSHGAGCIVENNVIPYISRCGFIDQRPESTAADIEKWAGIVERYHQIILPVLQLQAICLNSLCGEGEIVDQVIDFILSHTELFSAVLRDRTTVITLYSLQQLEVVSRIFYLLTPKLETMKWKLPQFPLFQGMLLNLLTKYSLAERWQPLIKPITPYESFLDSQYTIAVTINLQPTKVTLFMRLLTTQVLLLWSNLISFCRISKQW